MDQISNTRIKCAMIVYELERALGRFCRERSSAIGNSPAAKDILTRAGAATDLDPAVSAQIVIENSYLGEVLSLAQAAAKGTSFAEWLKQLEGLFSVLSIFDIRNAISHPNRPFPEYYWYRCAAIASDPTMDALGLFEITLAFQNAIDGKLEEPPDEWMHKMRWSIPAALPTNFEHAITGLYGRIRETVRLQKEIINPRAPLIAIVARGGVGKTSLLLQVISDFCLAAESMKHFDVVLWATLKQERLTASGIEILSAPSSMSELEIALASEAGEIFGKTFESFEDMKDQIGQKRVLLCLDNLETVLRDSPDKFFEFYENLPNSWRVIVTSRISVDGAKNISLDVLDKQGAIQLARAYYESKGAAPAKSEFFEKIAVGCSCNPLAIRLTIDSYVSGGSIEEALSKSEQEVLGFSFKNLLDNLSELENNILEALFVMDASSRSQLCGALGRDADEVAQALSRLFSVSLISRIETEADERYLLGSSIRDLLRSYPRNLSIRSQTAIWIEKTKSSEEQAIRTQLEQNVSPVSLSFIPAETSAQHIAYCKQIKSASRRDDRAMLVDVEYKLRQQLASNSTSSFLNRLYGWTLLELDDPGSSINYFQRAIGLDTTDPAPLFGLAMAIQAQGNRTDLYTPTKTLVDHGWGDPSKSGSFYANRIWSMYFLASNIQEKFGEVFDRTANWKDYLGDLPSFALSRAAAYRRLADLEYRNRKCDDSRLGGLIAKSAIPMKMVLEAQNFARWLIPELRKLLSEIGYYRSRGSTFATFKPADVDEIADLLAFLGKNEAKLIVAGFPAQELRMLNQISENAKIVNSGMEESSSRAKYVENGFTIAKVKRGGKPNATYVFAQDEREVDYFIHIDVFENGNWVNRHRLLPDVEVAIKFIEKRAGAALSATEAWLIED